MPFAVLALVFVLAGPPVPEPLPPVDLDVDGMALGEILSGLAGLGHLELVYEAGVEDVGTYPVTLRLEHMPFERALGALSGRTGLSIRVVGRRLVVSVSAERKSPPPLPNALSGAPRLLLSKYFRTSRMQGEPESGPPPELPPLYLTARSGRLELCWGPLFALAAPQSIDLPVPGDDEAAITVVQLAFDQISRRRFLAVEGPSEESGTLVVGDWLPASLEWNRGAETLAVTASSEPGRGCEPRPRGVRLQRKGDFIASWTLRLAESQALPENIRYHGCVRRQAGETGTEGRHRDVRGGPFKDVEIFSHASRDGRSVALVLAVGAVWLDPADGLPYYAPQFAASDGFVTPERTGTVAARMAAGAAASTPVELVLFAEENGDDCRDRPRATAGVVTEATR
jgi:hypothetical protein